MNDLRKLQLTQLEILRAFIKVCNDLNLRYFLDYGTLLGCIRHEGFIPWDDDIDVSMPREDYEIFLERGQGLLPEKYFIQTNLTDKEYTMNYAKIRDSETTFIEKSLKNSNINHGVFIDIFPYDKYDKKRKLINFINKKLFTLYNIQIYKHYNLDNSNETIKNKIINLLSNILYSKISLSELISKKDKIAKRYNEKEDVEDVMCYFDDAQWCAINKNIFSEWEIKKFEDLEVVVPKEYDNYLRIIYGDYMELPPEEERKPHHYNEIIDLEKPYKENIKQNQLVVK